MLLKTVIVRCPTSHSSGTTVASKTQRTVNPPALKGQPSNGVKNTLVINGDELEICGHKNNPCQIPAGSENKTCNVHPKRKYAQKP